MLNEIMVAAAGTITIDTAEYRELVERSAYLNVITAFAADPKTYILQDIACIVKDLLEKPVVTDEDEPDDDTEGEPNHTPEAVPEVAPATEGADDHA